MPAVLVLALVSAVLVILWLLVYRVSHPYTRGDLARARQDSLKRSHSVVSGKVQEHLAPLFPQFLSQFNPRDARFLGTPLDFIVFDGLDDGSDACKVVFVEVKTGKAALTPRERHIRDAVEAGRVEYQLLHLPGSVEAALEGAGALLDAPETPPALQP